MTVRFLRAWNGYDDGQIVETLSAAEENRLIGLGICVSYVDQGSIQIVKARVNTNDKIISIINPDGSDADVGSFGLSAIASEIQKAFAVGRFYGPDINRHASVFNRVNMRRERATFIPTGSSAAGKRRLLTYSTIRIGSGSRKTLTVALENQFMDVSVAGCPPVPNTNSLLVTGAQIQRNVWGTPIVQLKINGVNAANNLTLSPTDYDIVFDDLTPQDFGRSSFAVDETFIAQIEIEVNYNEFWPTIEGNDLFSMEGYIYDPAVSTWNRTNTAQPASPTWTTGAERTSMTHGWGIIALGKFSDGDPLTLNAFGDSIIAAANGASYIGRLYSRSKIAGCIVARGSAHTGALTAGGARATYLTKYGSSAIIEHGTNTASETLAQMQARINTAIALVRNASVVSPRNNKFNVILTNLLVAENRANNTILWNAGGTVEQYNTWMYTQIGLPTGPDIVIDPSMGVAGTIRASTEGKGVLNSDYYRFGAGMLADGASATFAVHPTSAAAIIMADNTAPQLPVY